MSIISDYYRNYSGIQYKEDYASIVCDAVEFVVERIKAYWSQKDPSGGVDLTGMPGEWLGFSPMEVQVFRPMTTKKSEPKKLGVTTMLSDERTTITVDDAFAELMADKCEAVDYLPDVRRRRDAATERAHLCIKPPTAYPIYAVSPAHQGGGRDNIVPILYNLELGEVYYVTLSFAGINKNGALKIKEPDNPGAIRAINWITGDILYRQAHFISRSARN